MRWPQLADNLIITPDAVSNLVDGNGVNLPEELKKLVGDEIDEVVKVAKGKADAAPLTVDTVEKCRLMQA